MIGVVGSVMQASAASEPAVVAALVSVLVAILTPYVSQKLRERAQDRVEAHAVEVRRIDGQEKFYADLQLRLERTERENDELQEKVLRLERIVLDREARESGMAADLARIREILEAEPPEVQAALAMLVRVLDTIRRRADVEGAA